MRPSGGVAPSMRSASVTPAGVASLGMLSCVQGRPPDIPASRRGESRPAVGVEATAQPHGETRELERRASQAMMTPEVEYTAFDLARSRGSVSRCRAARSGLPSACSSSASRSRARRVGRIELDRLLEGESLTPMISLPSGQPRSQRCDAFLGLERRGQVAESLPNLIEPARRQTAFQLHPPDYRIVWPARSDNDRANAQRPQTRPGRIARWARASHTRSSAGACLPARSSAVRTPSIGNGSTSSRYNLCRVSTGEVIVSKPSSSHRWASSKRPSIRSRRTRPQRASATCGPGLRQPV